MPTRLRAAGTVAAALVVTAAVIALCASCETEPAAGEPCEPVEHTRTVETRTGQVLRCLFVDGEQLPVWTPVR